MSSKNSLVLGDFVAYCLAHPELRFWQALRAWSGEQFILAIPRGWSVAREPFTEADIPLFDTYYREGREK